MVNIVRSHREALDHEKKRGIGIGLERFERSG
jgi:hypothetical protein